MKVKNIMADAALLCGRRDLADYLGKGETADAEASLKERETLLRCYNLAENELALDYLPLEKRDAFVSDGLVRYAAFSRPPVEILRVYGERGERLQFSAAEEGVRVRAGRVEIVYSYRPRVKGVSDETELCGKADGRLLALGTACEFALMNGMFEAASLLDGRYRDAIACACRERGGRLKMRRWA